MFAALVHRNPLFSTVCLPNLPFGGLPSSALSSTAENLDTPDILSQVAVTTVIRIRPYFVLKFGTGTENLEGLNLLFVAAKTSVIVPQLHAVLQGSLRRHRNEPLS